MLPAARLGAAGGSPRAAATAAQVWRRPALARDRSALGAASASGSVKMAGCTHPTGGPMWAPGHAGPPGLPLTRRRSRCDPWGAAACLQGLRPFKRGTQAQRARQRPCLASGHGVMVPASACRRPPLPPTLHGNRSHSPLLHLRRRPQQRQPGPPRWDWLRLGGPGPLATPRQMPPP